jgi:anti-sigma factor RsiW
MSATCQSGVDLLMEYLEGTLAADVRAALEVHVAGCPRCVAFVESYRRTPAMLRTATAVSLPPDLAQSLLDVLRAERRKNEGGG